MPLKVNGPGLLASSAAHAGRDLLHLPGRQVEALVEGDVVAHGNRPREQSGRFAMSARVKIAIEGWNNQAITRACGR